MFMKPLAMQRMADSVGVTLEYRVEPNWQTYSKLRDVAVRVEAELQSRGLSPRSRIDVQSFIWAALQMEEGKYGGAKKKKKSKSEVPSEVTEVTSS